MISVITSQAFQNTRNLSPAVSSESNASLFSPIAWSWNLMRLTRLDKTPPGSDANGFGPPQHENVRRKLVIELANLPRHQ